MECMAQYWGVSFAKNRSIFDCTKSKGQKVPPSIAVQTVIIGVVACNWAGVLTTPESANPIQDMAKT